MLVDQTLNRNRAEIDRWVHEYQLQAAKAKHDLAHIAAVFGLFDCVGNQCARCMVKRGFYKKSEITDIARANSRSIISF